MTGDEHHPRDTDITASRASSSVSIHSSSSSTSSVVPLKKRRLNEFKPFTETTPTAPASPNQHIMEIRKNAAASALATLSALSAMQSTKNDDIAPVITIPSPQTSPSSKDNLTVNSSSTLIEKLPAILSKVTDGNASDSDLSSNGSLGSAGPIPTPRAVHAPPVNSMMVDHTYFDYSVLSEDYLALYCGCPTEDVTNADGTSADGGARNTEEEKRRHARKMKKLKQIFRNMGQTRKNSGGVVQPFPSKLMEVLDRGDMEDSIRWMPHGRAFAVLQPPVFVKEVLPRFFKQSKVTSFTRQLNLWGFKRITKGTDAGAYYHELFLRGRPRLCMMMRRQKIKGTGIKLTPNPDTEPNFYTISEDRPLPPPAKKDTIRPLPPLLPQTGIMAHPNERRGLAQLSKQRSLRPPPHSHILTGNSSIAAASRFIPQTLDANKSHLMALNEARQQQQHAMQYPFTSQHSSQIQGGYNTHASQTGGSNTSPLLLNRLPVQDPAVSNHHTSLLRSMPDVHHAAYHHHLNSPELNARNQRQQAHYPDRQSVLYHEQRLVAEQQLRAEHEKMQINAILRERAAVEKEEQRQQAQHAYMSAQDLLYQVNGMAPEAQKVPSTSTSVEELKHRLLVAARALGGGQQPGNGAGGPTPESMGSMLHGGVGTGTGLMRGGASAPESLGGMMHGGLGAGIGLMRGGASVPPPTHQSQLHQMQSQQQQRVNFPALMSVLEQTQKVAAAAHEQSAMLQRFAQDLNGDSGGNAGAGGQFGNGSGFSRY